MTGESVDPQDFIDKYGLAAEVAVGRGMRMTLGQALEAERMLCPADVTQRQDPAKRIGYLANMLAAGGSLLPEDEYLIEAKE